MLCLAPKYSTCNNGVKLLENQYSQKAIEYLRSFKFIDNIFNRIELTEKIELLKKGDETKKIELFVKHVAIPALKDGIEFLDPRKTDIGKFFFGCLIAYGFVHTIRPFDNLSFEIILINRWLKKNPKIKLSFNANSKWGVWKLATKYPDRPWWQEATDQELKSLHRWNKLSSTINSINNIPLLSSFAYAILSGWKRFNMVTKEIQELSAQSSGITNSITVTK